MSNAQDFKESRQGPLVFDPKGTSRDFFSYFVNDGITYLKQDILASTTLNGTSTSKIYIADVRKFLPRGIEPDLYSTTGIIDYRNNQDPWAYGFVSIGSEIFSYELICRDDTNELFSGYLGYVRRARMDTSAADHIGPVGVKQTVNAYDVQRAFAVIEKLEDEVANSYTSQNVLDNQDNDDIITPGDSLNNLLLICGEKLKISLSIDPDGTGMLASPPLEVAILCLRLDTKVLYLSTGTSSPSDWGTIEGGGGSLPDEVIISDPDEGNQQVTNIYRNASTGRLVVVYKGS